MTLDIISVGNLKESYLREAVAEYEKYDAHRRAVEAADFDELTDGVRKLKG